LADEQNIPLSVLRSYSPHPDKLDLTGLTQDEITHGIKSSKLPDYIRYKQYLTDTNEALAQLAEMIIQFAVNLGLDPDQTLDWARKLQQALPQSEFDSWVATLLDGGPSIFMNTLIELQTTYPNGAAGVALVRETDPARIYVWNGTAWEDFGAYQGIEVKDGSITSSKIADGSISMTKLDYISIGQRNIFDKTKITPETYIVENGGTFPITGFSSSDFMSVTANQQLWISDDQTYAFYDTNKNLISWFNGGWDNATNTHILTVPNNQNISYIRVSLKDPETFMVLDTPVAPTEYKAFGTFDFDFKDDNVRDNFKDALELSGTIPMLKPGRTNLFDKSKAIDGYYAANNTGAQAALANTTMTDYIAVKPGAEMWFSKDNDIAFYDFNKVYVSGIVGGWGNSQDISLQNYLTIPNNRNIAFLRTAFPMAEKETGMILEGFEKPLSYIPYGYVDYEYADDRIAELFPKMSDIKQVSNLTGKKWNAMGDSITRGAWASKNYIQYISEATGVIATNYGVDGTMISTEYNSMGVGMAERYVNMSDDADYITVFGGTNDWGLGLVEIGTWDDGTSTTVYGAMQTLITGLINKYPTKKIGFILPLPRQVINGNNTLGDFVAVIKEVCDRYSIPTLDLYHGSGIMPGIPAHKTALMPDGTHPNAEGHRIIATKIQKFLESL